jgi:hypothetical protein
VRRDLTPPGQIRNIEEALMPIDDQKAEQAVGKGDTFLGAVAGADLPAPRIEGLGDVQVAHLRDEVLP